MRSLGSRTSGPNRTNSGALATINSADEESDAGYLPSQRWHGSERRRRGPRQSKAAQQASAPFESNTLLWTFLLVGLAFCGLDIIYIVHYVMRNDRFDIGTDDLRSLIGGDEGIMHEEFDISKITNPKIAEILAEIHADPDKQPVLQLLLDARVDLNEIDPSKLLQIPKWSDVTAVYGSEPVFVGLETCLAFQNNAIDPAEHFVTTAGTFNTGTNLLSELLIGNCRMTERIKKYGPSQRGVRWQAIWGKHTPVFNETFRQQHRTYKDDFLTANAMFAGVTVRDPLKWAQSMCRHEYGANWHHDKSLHCPNLIPIPAEQELLVKHHLNLSKTGAIPVEVHYAEFNVQHDSLIDFWNDWYREYANVKWPRLLVRFEDLVFFPQQVTKTVCECAGGELNHNRPFKFIVESAKKGDAAHGKLSDRTTYIDALVKYGTEQGRYKGYTREDLDYVRKHLDPKLMELFHYKYPDDDISDEALRG
ncbi:hypothetical protein MPSEU_000155000 [Mayamaea pseudoterrestris]|nr:hypothetical protein MPSEU_000155000 [Mayamaea pseudoterrestris]